MVSEIAGRGGGVKPVQRDYHMRDYMLKGEIKTLHKYCILKVDRFTKDTVKHAWFNFIIMIRGGFKGAAGTLLLN